MNHAESKCAIDSICRKYGITNYIINDDESIDVNDDVYLLFARFTELPLTFNKVSGDFKCYSNYLTTLFGSPREVGGDFDCSGNELTTLEGCPIKVGGDFMCSENYLTSLVGIPSEVGRFIDFEINKLHPFYEKVYIELGNKLTIFIKYMKHCDVFEPVFNEQNGSDLIAEIKDGLK